jgi:hypothetical protein
MEGAFRQIAKPLGVPRGRGMGDFRHVCSPEEIPLPSSDGQHPSFRGLAGNSCTVRVFPAM